MRRSRIARRAVVTAALFCAGCANPINAVTYDRYYAGGLQAAEAGDWKSASIQFSRAFGNARLGNLGPKAESAALYNYGLAVGQLCEFDEAKRALLEALRLEEAAEGPDGGYAVLRLFELARMHADHSKWSESAQYYARALPLGRAQGVDRGDPIAFAVELERYATVLEKSGDAAGAIAPRAEAAELRRIHPGASALFVAKTYPIECPPTDFHPRTSF